MKLWHFYHACAQENIEENVWFSIVDEHVNALRSSGLASKLNKTYIGVIGNRNNAKKISKIFEGQDIKHEICVVNDSGWEQETLSKLYEFSLNNDGYVLYAHTKGAFHQGAEKNLHRQTMNKYLIQKWSENVDLLAKGVCATGVFFLMGSPEKPFVTNKNEFVFSKTDSNIKNYRGFFAGNFWWCNLDLIKKMGYPSVENRIKAEAWMNNLYDSIDGDKYMVYDLFVNEFDCDAVARNIFGGTSN